MKKHRLDSLTDGIFAVAMTLLVIDLKLPEAVPLHDNEALVQAMADLIPRLISWVISFGVLAFFWWGHSRALHYVREVNGGLVGINLLFLLAVGFTPFASAVSGTHPLFAAQCVYSVTMAFNALAAMALWRYIYRHPALCETPMPVEIYRGSRLRTGMLVVISVVACAIAWYLPTAGNAAFMLMAFVRPLSRRLGNPGTIVA